MPQPDKLWACPNASKDPGQRTLPVGRVQDKGLLVTPSLYTMYSSLGGWVGETKSGEGVLFVQ